MIVSACTIDPRQRNHIHTEVEHACHLRINIPGWKTAPEIRACHACSTRIKQTNRGEIGGGARSHHIFHRNTTGGSNYAGGGGEEPVASLRSAEITLRPRKSPALGYTCNRCCCTTAAPAFGCFMWHFPTISDENQAYPPAESCLTKV